MRLNLYKKVGHRYKAVQHYDSAVMDCMPNGAHLVVVSDGCRSVRFNVDPTLAPVLAALHTHKEQICKDVLLKGRLKLEGYAEDPKEREKAERAYAAWLSVMGEGEEFFRLYGCSAADLVNALEESIIKALDTGKA